MISIIVPVYNVEKYLRQALQSIVRQTYTNLQIICIDDGSLDGSRTVLEEYAQGDSRIEVYSQNNAGCSAARNLGLKYVKGEYLMFVDADDWMDAETCERAVEQLESERADLVLWSYCKEYGMHSDRVLIWDKKRVFSCDEMPVLRRRILGLTREEMNQPERMDSLGTLWGKLYRSSLFLDNEIRFVDLAEIGSAEDVLANLYVMAHANRAVYLPECYYHYRKTNDVSQTRNYRPRLRSQWKCLFSRMEAWRGEFDCSAESRCVLNNRMAYALVGLGLNELSSGLSPACHLRQISEILHADWYRVAVKNLDLSYMPVHWKAVFFCAKHHMTWGVFCFLLIIKYIINK